MACGLRTALGKLFAMIDVRVFIVGLAAGAILIAGFLFAVTVIFPGWH